MKFGSRSSAALAKAGGMFFAMIQSPFTHSGYSNFKSLMVLMRPWRAAS